MHFAFRFIRVEVLLCLLMLIVAGPAWVRVTAVVIDRIESPTFEGHAFGDVGQYEKIVGRMFGAVDPKTAAHANIVNLDKAPQNAAGLVEYSTDFYILKPIDPTKGNRTLFSGILNRGSKIDFNLLNDVPFGKRTNKPITAADAGNGFLMRQGYSVVWTGWQAKGKAGAQCCVRNKPGFMGADLPIPSDNGQALVGTVRDLFVGQEQTNAPDHVTATRSYAVSSRDSSKVHATVRNRAEETGVPISFCETEAKNPCWSFEDEQTIHLRGGFQSGRLYEIKYQGRDPPVLRLGFAATRDVVSFLRYETQDDAGKLNPLRFSQEKTGIDTVLAFGISQSGRYLQEHVWAGFNQDEAERIVFDGLIADIGGAGKTFTNFAFGRPGRTRGSHQDSGFPENLFPFAYGSQGNPLTGKRDGMLRNGSRRPGDGFDPHIMVTNTASEYWRKSASLLHTGTRMNDVSIPDNVRLYFFASTQHFPIFSEPFQTSLGARLPSSSCQQEHNPAFRGRVMRALLAALHEWVQHGTSPPPSAIPTHLAGTLVAASASIKTFPNIPGVQHVGSATPTIAATQSKRSEAYYTPLVSKTDIDGNDLGGIRLPDIAVPLGTHTGWAVRADVPGAMCGNRGQFIPFAQTQQERETVADPRPSLAERYPSAQAYIAKVTRTVQSLEAQRLLLAEDAAAYIADAPHKAPGVPPPLDQKNKEEGDPLKKEASSWNSAYFLSSTSSATNKTRSSIIKTRSISASLPNSLAMTQSGLVKNISTHLASALVHRFS